MENRFPTPVLKCTNAVITGKAIALSFRQQIGASSKLPEEFTIAISKEDMKKIVNDCVDDSIDPLAFDKLLGGD